MIEGYWNPFEEAKTYTSYFESSPNVSQLIVLRINSRMQFVVSFYHNHNVISVPLRVDSNCITLEGYGKQDPVAFRNLKKLFEYFISLGKTDLYKFSLSNICDSIPAPTSFSRMTKDRGSFIIEVDELDMELNKNVSPLPRRLQELQKDF